MLLPIVPPPHPQSWCQAISPEKQLLNGQGSWRSQAHCVYAQPVTLYPPPHTHTLLGLSPEKQLLNRQGSWRTQAH